MWRWTSLRGLTDSDALLLYYAGHGEYDEDSGEGYWIPHDARQRSGSRKTKEDWVWNSALTKMVNASDARHVLVVADSCYGGSLFRGGGHEPPDAQDAVV